MKTSTNKNGIKSNNSDSKKKWAKPKMEKISLKGGTNIVVNETYDAIFDPSGPIF